jgi:hypothetical protein
VAPDPSSPGVFQICRVGAEVDPDVDELSGRRLPPRAPLPARRRPADQHGPSLWRPGLQPQLHVGRGRGDPEGRRHGYLESQPQ